jgi:hypothetical protein
MAPVLLCPECGTKHPITDVNGAAFPCNGCGRTLKVPEQARVAVAEGAAPKAPKPAVPDADSTRVMSAAAPVATVAPPVQPPVAPVVPPLAPVARPRPVSGPSADIPPRWVRFLLWIVAIPLAFAIVFVAAKLIGVLTSNQVEDVALDQGWQRFVPIARLLPFVALVTAGLMHGFVYGLGRLRARRHAGVGPTGPRGSNGSGDAGDIPDVPIVLDGSPDDIRPSRSRPQAKRPSAGRR